MLWLTWRQHRAELAGAALLLAAITAVLAVSGASMHAAYRADGVAACLADQGAGQAVCNEVIAQFRERYIPWGDQLTWLNLLPALAGVFIGAPLLARELEHGTWKLAFTQTVTRTRWLATKLTLVGLAITLLAAAFTAVFTWWRAPLDAIHGRIEPPAFNFEGLSPAAAALFAFAAGTLLGALLRRTVAAMALTLLAYFAVRTPVELALRPRYQTPKLRTLDAAQPRGRPGSTDWILGQGMIDATGRRLTDAERTSVLYQADNTGLDFDSYMAQHGLRHYIEYQPSSRFWTFQLLEAGLFLALAATLLAAAVWLIRRRTT